MDASDKELENQKKLAFYSNTLSAWYTTKFEKDKHLLSLSSAGIGLLVTLLTTVGSNTSFTVTMYALALFFFLVCIISVLCVFSRNSGYLEGIVAGNDMNDVLLDVLDKTAVFSFVLGVVFTLLVGFFSSIEQSREKEYRMRNKIEKMVKQNDSTEKKSLNGVSRMRPTNNDSQSQSSGDSSSSKTDDAKK